MTYRRTTIDKIIILGESSKLDELGNRLVVAKPLHENNRLMHGSLGGDFSDYKPTNKLYGNQWVIYQRRRKEIKWGV